MATRSFLLESDFREALSRLLGDGSFPENIKSRRQEFSLWLEDRLRSRLKAYGDFAALKPVLLGSWARHELSPKSDIDLLFAGAEQDISDFSAKAFKDGLKLRARTPEKASDWSVGVEPFDILALKFARGETPEAEAVLAPQRETAVKLRRQILKAVREERDERRSRQDSISNYLEPNLKFGAGGLRDIEQALAMRELFPEKFAGTEPYPFKVLETIKDEFLFLRSLLHLIGSGDILSAHDQIEIAKHLKMESPQQLMKFVQSELERASFYADWAVANAMSETKKQKSARRELTDLNEAIQRLKDEPGILVQYQLRLSVDKLAKPLSPEEQGKALHRAIAGDVKDTILLALHRARVFEVLIPDLKRLKGHVQHDHYHRFTADAHIVQTLREVQRSRSQKRNLGVMSKLTAELSAGDWWTLKLTALFHDLAKGKKGDHSSEGAKLVDKYLAEWNFPDSLREDVRWLVENHLLLSTAAFRQNPQSPSTWKRLFDRGVTGRRLILLALFTAIDIRGTNPEAWTDWKAQLLYNLVENLNSPQAVSLQNHLKYAGQSRKTDLQEWLMAIDPVLLQSLSPKVLVEDLKAAAKAKQNLLPKVIRAKNKLWVRFHRREDEPGIFLNLVKQLFGLGLNIQISSVSTLKGVGVYDWFQLKTEKTPKQVTQWLNLATTKPVTIPQVTFQSIDLMSQDQDEWILSFRGRNQRGLLLNAAQALHAENLSLRWARAHTWGQQIDDIFAVQPFGEVEKTLEKLRSQFVT